MVAPFGKNADMESIPAREASTVRFDETVDVAVVGLGVAGHLRSSRLAGWCRGAGRGTRRGPGGTSANSGGLIYLGGGTELQRACGFEDSVENMATFLHAALGPAADDARLDAYCEGSSDHFDWLVSIGVPFRAAFCDEPNRESADDSGLVFSGGEDSYPFDDLAVPVPRGHKPQCIDSAGGFLMGAWARRLRRARPASCRRLGLRHWSWTGERSSGCRYGPMTGSDPFGLGAGWFFRRRIHLQRSDGRGALPLRPRPRPRLADRHPQRRRSRDPHGCRCRRSDDQAERFECALPLGPPHRLARGILINRQGERFINEDTYTGRIGLHALRDHDGFVYMITDDVIHERNLLGLRVGLPRRLPKSSPSTSSVPPEALARTLRNYNEAAARGEDPQFHKRAPFLQPIGLPPATGIGAIDLRVDHGAIYATFTLGGLVTDPTGPHSMVADRDSGVVRGRPHRRQSRGEPLRQRHQPG